MRLVRGRCGPARSAEPGCSRSFGRHRRPFLAQILIAVISIALLVWRVDLVEALTRIPEVNVAWAAAGLLTFTGSKAIHTYRWRC